MKAGEKADEVGSYIHGFPKAVQARLKEIRSIIRTVAPDAVEKISYRMPAYFLNGFVVYFAAFKNHIGFYPGESGVAEFPEELKGYKSAKGSIQFPHDRPLPLGLIKKIVKFRVRENLQRPKRRIGG